jgi:adenosylcobinamide amidohydrolase
MLVWRLETPVRAIASGPFGGGLGMRHWVVNATVHKDYNRLDPDRHLAELAELRGLSGPGVGMLTAVDVGRAVTVEDGGVTVTATVGLGYPTWAAAPAEYADDEDKPSIGTINLVVWCPVALQDAALVNTVATITEAKTQALWDCGVKATGTASDAVFVACVQPTGPDAESYGGPRSVWGARCARAVHAAVGTGTDDWLRKRG